MKAFILILFLTGFLYSQESGVILNSIHVQDYDGNGIINANDVNARSENKHTEPQPQNVTAMNFSLFWSSPDGAFTNVWDGMAGYFDNDTLLDIAGYSFNPSKFYIWEQSSVKPDSFYKVAEFLKPEGGSFGPIAAADIDGDGKTEICSADLLGICRVYIYSNTGNNTYVDRNTQTIITHPSNGEGGRGLFIGDMNKNGQKELIVMRGSSTDGGEVRVWQFTGSPGVFTFSNIYTYTTVSYLFGKGGFGDADNDGWDEMILSYGGFPVYDTYIGRIEFDSASSSFQYSIFTAGAVGFPTSWKIYDIDGNGIKELISTHNSNNKAGLYIFRSNGTNSFQTIDSIFETGDNNSMLSSDIKILTGNSRPSISASSFNSKAYVYNYTGSGYTKEYESGTIYNALYRILWLPWTNYDGFFTCAAGSNTAGTFYIYKSDIPVYVKNNNESVKDFILYQNYPNPFNPVTRIRFSIPQSAHYKGKNISLVIYNSTGQMLESLVEHKLQPGDYEVIWDADKYPSGIYYYVLYDDEYKVNSRKMILLK